jgi:hypothetical protein
LQQQQSSVSTPALSSSPSAYPYSTVSSNGGHGTPNSVRSLSTASMASSSSRSMRDYPHAQSSDNSANDQLRRPTLPPPAVSFFLLSYFPPYSIYPFLSLSICPFVYACVCHTN